MLDFNSTHIIDQVQRKTQENLSANVPTCPLALCRLSLLPPGWTISTRAIPQHLFSAQRSSSSSCSDRTDRSDPHIHGRQCFGRRIRLAARRSESAPGRAGQVLEIEGKTQGFPLPEQIPNRCATKRLKCRHKTVAKPAYRDRKASCPEPLLDWFWILWLAGTGTPRP